MERKPRTDLSMMTEEQRRDYKRWYQRDYYHRYPLKRKIWNARSAAKRLTKLEAQMRAMGGEA